MNDSLTFYYLDAHQQPQGPHTPRELNEMRKTGALSWDSLIAEPGAEDWLPMVTYADLIDAGSKVTNVADLKFSPAPNRGLAAAGSGLQALGVAVTLVNPIVGVGMIVAGSKVKKAGK